MIDNSTELGVVLAADILLVFFFIFVNMKYKRGAENGTLYGFALFTAITLITLDILSFTFRESKPTLARNLQIGAVFIPCIALIYLLFIVANCENFDKLHMESSYFLTPLTFLIATASAVFHFQLILPF